MLLPDDVVTAVPKMMGLVSLVETLLPSCNESPRMTNESWESSLLVMSDLLSVPSVMWGGSIISTEWNCILPGKNQAMNSEI